MGFSIGKLNLGQLASARQYGMAISQTCQGRCIEARKRMERIAFDIATFGGRVDKAQIKMGVMSDHDRSRAFVLFDLAPNGLKDISKSEAFRHRDTAFTV